MNDLDRNIDLQRKVLDLLNCVVLTSPVTDENLLNPGFTATVLNIGEEV